LKLSIKETLLQLQRNSRHKLDKKALTAVQGYSYFNFIPFVSRQSGVRTNLGLNNFTLSSIVNGDKPSANVMVILLTNKVWLDQKLCSRIQELIKSMMSSRTSGDVVRGSCISFR
jgi:hypothetical protein